MRQAIVARNLSKHYKNVQALKNVGLEIPQSQITGLVGPNGAGKSTFIKSVIGTLNLTAGSIEVLGFDPIKDRYKMRKNLGYMPQDSALYEDISARENVSFFARLHKVKNPRGKAQELLKMLNLEERFKSPVYTLSGGMKKRVSLASALVHDPDLLLLDEPTAALDPLLKRNLWKKFREFVEEGKTLLISTHLIDEAMLCDSVILLQKGEVIAHDTPKNLIAKGTSKLIFHKSKEEWTEKVEASGKAMANLLHQYGLSRDIESLDIDTKNLEDVMIELLNQKKKQ
ncbi:MAG: ABC transporter ATP-binding protein [bacterium]